MRIIGPPSADYATVYGNASAAGAAPRYLADMLPALWNAAESLTIDPVGVAAQAFKETGAGKFPGRVKPEFHNTAGIKNRHLGLYPGIDDDDQPLAHARFADWNVGALAHAQHLRAYTGWPVPGLIVDPRYWLVAGKHRCENFEDLSGRWAPSPTYGPELVAVARRLQAAS